jgi:hypothetical protein
VPLIHCLNGLDRQQQQGIERAGTLARFPIGAVCAHVAVEAVNVGVDRSTSGRMRNLNNFRQVEFDTAALAMGSTRRSPRGTVDAVATDLLADFRHILVEFRLGVHITPPFPLVTTAGQKSMWGMISKRNAGCGFTT